MNLFGFGPKFIAISQKKSNFLLRGYPPGRWPGDSFISSLRGQTTPPDSGTFNYFRNFRYFCPEFSVPDVVS